VLKDVSGVKVVSLLGSAASVKFKTEGSGVQIELPELSDQLMRQPAWVLKVSR
jgi:hypothetical protein